MKRPTRNIDFSFWDKKLLETIENEKVSIGLSSGKMGFTIYFYILSRLKNNKDYQFIAETFLDDIIDQIQLNKSPGISNGLSGIGLEINFLIKNNYIQGNINQILREVDDYLFSELSYPESYQLLSSHDLIHLLIYFNIRLGDQKTGGEQEYLYRELIVHTVNFLYGRLEFTFFEEPHEYTVNYGLPLLLYAFGQTYKCGFYNDRLRQITNELSVKIFSIIPTLNANKLFLLWGMHVLSEQLDDEKWKEHTTFLARSIKLDTIITDELRDRNIFFEKGLTSVYLLAEELKSFFSLQEISLFKEEILNKIIHSQVWKLLENDEYFSHNMGLTEGYCGVSLLLHTLKTETT